MRTKKRRLIEYKPEGVSCAECKHAVCVDQKHQKYYCLHPEERKWLYYGVHICGKGESK